MTFKIIHPIISVRQRKYMIYHAKAKKLMEQNQRFLLNRIKTIKQQGNRIIKKRQNQLKLFLKLQSVKRQHFFCKSPIITPRKDNSKQSHLSTTTAIRTNNKTMSFNCHHQQTEPLNEGFKGQRLFLEKIQNAKRVKYQKQQNQVKISKRRALQLNRKLQSAGLIRKNRQKCKQTVQNFYKQKQHQIRQIKIDQIQRQKQRLLTIEKNVRDLEREEQQALYQWKRVVQEDDVIMFEGLQANEAYKWNQ